MSLGGVGHNQIRPKSKTRLQPLYANHQNHPTTLEVRAWGFWVNFRVSTSGGIDKSRINPQGLTEARQNTGLRTRSA